LVRGDHCGLVALRQNDRSAELIYLSLTSFLSESPLLKKVDEMSGNGIAASGGPAVSSQGTTGASGYRVAMVSGALEVSARVASAEELDLLVRVLEANKILWTNSGKSEPKIQLKAKPKIELFDEVPSQEPEAAKKASEGVHSASVNL
jgi:hypothetical protein